MEPQIRRHKHYIKPNKGTKGISEAIMMGIKESIIPLINNKVQEAVNSRRSLSSERNAQMETNSSESTGSGLEKNPGVITCMEKPKPPKFYGTEEENPVKFIRDLKSHMRKLHVHEDRIEIAMECVSVSVRSVLNIFKANWRDFKDFEREFLDIYWNLVRQDKVREKIIKGVWRKDKGKTKLEYFANKLDLARELTHKIPESHLINIIMRQLPEMIQAQWIAMENPTLGKAAALLKGHDGYVVHDHDRTLHETRIYKPIPRRKGKNQRLTEAKFKNKQGDVNQLQIDFEEKCEFNDNKQHQKRNTKLNKKKRTQQKRRMAGEEQQNKQQKIRQLQIEDGNQQDTDSDGQSEN